MSSSSASFLPRPPVFALDHSSRALLASGAFAAFAAAFVTTPFVARGAASAGPLRTPSVAPLGPPATFAAVVPRRDPFAGGPAESRATTAGAVAPPAVALPAFPAIPPIPTLQVIPALPKISGALGALPPNAGAAGVALPFAPAARVTAIVTGTRPFALVDEGGTTRIVTVGDYVGGDAIVAIGADGVRLARGAMLRVMPTASPTDSIPGGR